jgi:hypothetical protein
MKATIESTDAIAHLETRGGEPVKARVWHGTTEAGVEFFAYIVRVAVHKDSDNSQFERELTEQPHTPLNAPISLRFII